MPFIHLNDSKKLERIKVLLKDQLDWFMKNKSDDDLLYDESISEISNLDRGDCEELLRILAEE